jgi:hypothetical protein
VKQLLMFLILTLPAGAQWRHFGRPETRATGYFGGGAAVPINPAARALDTGWSLSGGVGVTYKWTGVMLDANFSDFGLNRATLARVGAPHGNQKYWSVTVNPVFHVNERGPIDFYVTAGGGLYSQVTEFHAHDGSYGPYGYRGDLLGRNTLYKPGVNGGAGFAFNLGSHSPVKIFTEARFHHMFTDGSGSGVSYIPITVGLCF